MARLVRQVDLTITDIARSKTFYEPVMRYLGYEIILENRRDIIFAPADSEPRFSFALHLSRPESRGREHDRNAPGLRHLAFDAESREDVDGLHAFLREIGARVLYPPAVCSESNYYALFFADPDGIVIEFSHRPHRDSACRETAPDAAQCGIAE